MANLEYQSKEITFQLNKATRLEAQFYSKYYGIEENELVELSLDFALYLFNAYPVGERDVDFRINLYRRALGNTQVLSTLCKIYPALHESVEMSKALLIELEGYIPKEKWLDPEKKHGVFKPEEMIEPSTRVQKLWDLFHEDMETYKGRMVTTNHSVWPRRRVMEKQYVSVRVNAAVWEKFCEMTNHFKLKGEACVGTTVKCCGFVLQFAPSMRTQDPKMDLLRIHFKSKQLFERLAGICTRLHFDLNQVDTARKLIRKYAIALTLDISEDSHRSVKNIDGAPIPDMPEPEVEDVSYLG